MPAFPTLPAPWPQHFEEGVSLRVGACSSDGTPHICRALAGVVLADGRVQVLLAGGAAQHVLQALAQTGQVALVAASPGSHRTLHTKGGNAVVGDAGPEHEALLAQRLEAFAQQLAPFGFDRTTVLANWYASDETGFKTITFSVSGAWNQTPGPGAGEAVELV